MREKADELVGFLQNQFRAIETLWEARHQIPTLMLLYSALDIVAFLRSGGSDGEAGARFRDFADRYVATHLQGITGDDLWSARSVILRTAGPEAAGGVVPQVKEIIYSWGSADTELLNDVFALSPEPSRYVALSVEELIAALGNGMNEFIGDLEKDSGLYAACLERVGVFRAHVPVGWGK